MQKQIIKFILTFSTACHSQSPKINLSNSLHFDNIFVYYCASGMNYPLLFSMEIFMHFSLHPFVLNITKTSSFTGPKIFGKKQNLETYFNVRLFPAC